MIATLCIALLGVLTVACAPTPSGPNTGSQFCQFWNKVAEEPPTADKAVLVKEDVVALADATDLDGGDCSDPGANVELDGAVLAEGEEVPAELGNPSSAPLAAITGPEIAASAPVFENLTVTSLSTNVSQYGITIRGSVAIRLSGVTSSMSFSGRFNDMANWSVSLSSGAFSIPGLTTSPAQFVGTLRSSNGVPSLSLNAAVSSAKIGDIEVRDAGVAVSISPATGVSAAVQGSIKVGPSTASGTVAVEFDPAGAIVSAKADVAAHFVGYQPGGSVVDLQGTLKLDGNAQETVASFRGNGVLGDLVINTASGSLILGTDTATFAGVLDIQQGQQVVRFNGSIVFEDGVAYVPYLTLEAGGEFSGTLDDGQQFSVAGTLSTDIVGGQVRTVVTGDFQVGTLKAVGSAIVEDDGISTALYVTAELSDAGFDAALSGVVVISDGRAELVDLDAVVDATVQLGDVTLTGARLEIRSTFGSALDLNFTSGIQVGTQVDLTGSVEASFGPNGTLISLKGDVSGQMNLDGWNLRNLTASVVASPQQVSVTGSGKVAMANFPLEITFGGTYTSSAGNPNWSLTGSGALRIFSLDIASANFVLKQGETMRAYRVGFRYTVLVFPSYFEGTFYMKPTGGCERVDITAYGDLIGLAILKGVLPGAIGCPVN